MPRGDYLPVRATVGNYRVEMVFCPVCGAVLSLDPDTDVVALHDAFHATPPAA